MKHRHLLCCISIFLNFSAISQIPKGSLFFGGDIAFSFEKGNVNNQDYWGTESRRLNVALKLK